MAVTNILKSTIFNKVVMAVTGFILVMFILGHVVGNLQIFIGPEVFNAYAHFLQSLGELLWVIRLVLLVAVVLHIYTSLKLKFLNLSAKPQGYKMSSYVKSTLYSRTMIYTGIAILLFVIYHLLHFTAGVADPSIYGYQETFGPGNLSERHDAFKMVILGFQKPLVSAVYMAAVILLGFHLSHAIQSMFQTLGWSSPSLTAKLIKAGKIIAFLITLGFISIPISVLTGLVGGSI
jgi:succinate dehydrogenase / fumarate reductase cytochrome b subunit